MLERNAQSDAGGGVGGVEGESSLQRLSLRQGPSPRSMAMEMKSCACTGEEVKVYSGFAALASLPLKIFSFSC